MFWTIRVPDDSVEVDLDDARASIDLRDVEVRDFFNFLNFLNGGPSVPADVSFHVRWSGVNQRTHLHDNQKKFDANLILDTATMAWSARRKDFKFESDPAHTSFSLFAAIGRERNGVFFS